MAWEKRGNRLYYYRKIREGPRVVSQYTGTGEYALLLSKLDREETQAREYNRAQWKKQKAETENIDRDIEQLEKNINACVRAMLLTYGYHPHKGQWRKTRDA